MNLIRAKMSDLENTIKYYDNLIDHTADMDKYARWIKGIEGFEHRGELNLYAENTGWTDFMFYEYALL